MFDPIVGRWLQEDPTGFTAGDTDLYRYVGNNVLNATDASGLQPVPINQRIPGNSFGNWQINQVNSSRLDVNIAKFQSSVKIKFIPNPNTVNATEIAFVQVARLTDTRTGKVAAQLPKQTEFRLTSDDWAVDRINTKTFGWFGYGNEGDPEIITGEGLDQDVTVFPVSPGMIAPQCFFKDADLEDIPSGKGSGYKFEFQTYAVAKAGIDAGKIYGGISWGFEVKPSFVGQPEVISLQRWFLPPPTKGGSQLEAAVLAWDKQATGPVNQRSALKQVPLGPDIFFPERVIPRLTGLQWREKEMTNPRMIP